MTELLKEIKLRVKCLINKEIIKLMGYKNVEKGIVKLESLLSSPCIFDWFKQNSYDFNWSLPVFLNEHL